MKVFISIIASVVSAFVVSAQPAYADDKPPKGNDTGCCFSFDDSPVTLVFCMTEDACRLGSER